MKLRTLLVSLATSLLMLSASAAADAAGWQHNVSHRHVSGKTSLKVTGPDGLKVQVSIDGSPKEDTIPAIFALPDRDAFVPVTVVSADGQTFSQKIEVKSHQQAELVLRYEAPAAPAAPAAAGRKFMGHALNATERCKDADKWELKMDFLRRSDGSVVRSVVVKPASVSNLEIDAGAYDVRLFARRAGATGDYFFYKTVPFDVTADEWIFAYGCRSRSDKPAQIEKPAK